MDGRVNGGAVVPLRDGPRGWNLVGWKVETSRTVLEVEERRRAAHRPALDRATSRTSTPRYAVRCPSTRPLSREAHSTQTLLSATWTKTTRSIPYPSEEEEVCAWLVFTPK